MSNKNNNRAYRYFNFFEVNESNNTGTKLQLLFVLSSFISSLGIAMVLAESPKHAVTKSMHERMSLYSQATISKEDQNNR